ncbi:MAG: hypothetical protein K2P79_01640 [Sphingomonas sp.]|nr:hypothetical protein [Sphingomonas sp.]
MVTPLEMTSPMPVRQEQQLSALLARHAAQTRLCAALEAMADTLPQRPDAAGVQALSAALRRYQEDVSFDIESLGAYLDADTASVQTITRSLLAHIAARRIGTAATADDLIVAIEQPPGAAHCLCAEALGFMLRSFFESCRDALFMEEVAILLIVGNRPRGAARDLLEQRRAMLR